VNEQEHLDDGLETLSRELRRLPTPVPPGGLVSRVRKLAHLELAGRAEERFSRQVLIFLLCFSWTVSVFSFLAVRLLTSTLSWSVGYFVSAWISVAAVLVLLAFHVRRERTLA
jgi:hypothetical protein